MRSRYFPSSFASAASVRRVQAQQARGGGAQQPCQPRPGGDDPAQLGPAGGAELVGAVDHRFQPRQNGRSTPCGGSGAQCACSGGAVRPGGETPAAQPNGESVGAGEEGDVDVGELVDEPQPETAASGTAGGGG